MEYLKRLPADAILERGREWFRDQWPLDVAGEHILARHATLDDRVMLEEAGSTALASRNMYRLCAVVDALATIGARESLPFLAEVYSTAPYSHARGRVVRALLPHASDDVAYELIVEALWDCEADAREFACTAVTADDIVSAARLAEMANDEFEEPDVRRAAQRVLDNSSGSAPAS